MKNGRNQSRFISVNNLVVSFLLSCVRMIGSNENNNNIIMMREKVYVNQKGDVHEKYILYFLLCPPLVAYIGRLRQLPVRCILVIREGFYRRKYLILILYARVSDGRLDRGASIDDSSMSQFTSPDVL